MPRDTDKFVYYQIAVPRGSEMYRALLDDAKANGVQPVRLIPVRLADYYTFLSQLKTVGIAPAVIPVRDDAPEIDQADMAKMNALAAAAAWGGNDDED